MNTKYKVLAICGGGVWGIGVLWVLMTLEKLGFNIKGIFKAYAGTSVGGIIAALLAYGYSATESYTILKKELSTVFTKYSWWYRYTRTNSPRYNNKYLAAVLDKYIKPGTRMCDLKSPLYLLAWRNNGIDRNKVFNPSDEVLVRDAVMASTAAPWYFDFVTIDGDELSDGGLWQNNPALTLLISTLYEMKTGPGEIKLSDISICTFITSGNGRGRKLSGKNWLFVFKEILGQLLSGRASGTDYMVRKLIAIVGGGNLTMMPSISNTEGDIGLDAVKDVDKIIAVWKRYYGKNETAILSWFTE